MSHITWITSGSHTDTNKLRNWKKKITHFLIWIFHAQNLFKIYFYSLSIFPDRWKKSMQFTTISAMQVEPWDQIKKKYYLSDTVAKKNVPIRHPESLQQMIKTFQCLKIMFFRQVPKYNSEYTCIYGKKNKGIKVCIGGVKPWTRVQRMLKIPLTLLYLIVHCYLYIKSNIRLRFEIFRVSYTVFWI